MPNSNEYPSLVRTYEHIERMGNDCRIASTVSIWRRSDFDESQPYIAIGDEVVIFGNVRLVVADRKECPTAGIKIGSRVYINVGSFLSGEGGLEIGDEVLIGPHVRILTAGHQIDFGQESILRNPLTFSPVHIGSGAWLGAGCTILQGRKIGAGAVVAAGAVVTQDVPPMAIVAGNPARIVRTRKFGLDNNSRHYRASSFWQALLRKIK